jgi:hypothetical protein
LYWLSFISGNLRNCRWIFDSHRAYCGSDPGAFLECSIPVCAGINTAFETLSSADSRRRDTLDEIAVDALRGIL